MKTELKRCLLVVTLLVNVTVAKAQTQPTASIPYKDNVVENSNAEADIKVVSDYLHLIVSGDLDGAKLLLTSNYKGYGPSPLDSATSEQTINEWRQLSKIRTNQKISFVNTTFRVKSGMNQGDWVSVWGDYYFTQNGKDISLPFQFTARLTNGKINVSRIYYDRLYPLQTLGYKISAPENNK